VNDSLPLRRGDSDRKKIWGGKKQTTAPAYSVKKLQADLKTLGVYTDRIDGDFGKISEKSLKIFQWVLANSSNAIKNRSLVKHTPVPNLYASGRLDPVTFTNIQDWLKKKLTAGGDLVRVDTASLSNISLGPGFKHIGKPQVKKPDLVISRDALGMVKLMNDSAAKLGLTIVINQGLRLNKARVSGAVVPPATKSQHLIGHAIDCNIVDGNSWNNSRDFKNDRQTAGAEKFIARMKKASHRWGGDFSRVDTPHFDKQLDSNSFSYDAKFYLNQNQIASGAPIEVQTITD